MADEIKELKQKVAALEQKLALYENDPEKNGYYAFKRILNQQVDYLKGFTIKDKISGKASEDATYARSKDMWESLPKMISDCANLKRELKISPEEDIAESKQQRITPESMAEAIGDNKLSDV